MGKSRERSKRVFADIIAAADTENSDQCPRCAGVGRVQALCKVREVRQGSAPIFYYVPRPMSCVSCSGTGAKVYVLRVSGRANPVQLTPDGPE